MPSDAGPLLLRGVDQQIGLTDPWLSRRQWHQCAFRYPFELR